MSRLSTAETDYTISTEDCVVMVSINPDCTYEQFLEKIADNAIFEAERLYVLNDEIEQDYEDMCGNFVTLKEEVTNDI